MPLPVGTERLRDALHAEQIEADGRPDDVGDAVEGPDLVEMDLLQRHAVHRRLGLGQAAEDAPGQLALRRGQLAPVEDRFDVGQVAVDVFLRRLDRARPWPRSRPCGPSPRPGGWAVQASR